MSENSQSAEALARGFSPAATSLKPHERVPAAMAHLVSLPPIWGVVFSAGIIHYYRESSRAVAFQARLAIFLHLTFLGIGAGGILIRLLATLFEAAFPDAGFAALAQWFDHTKAVALFIVFSVFPVVAAALCCVGRGVAYPLISRRLWEPPHRDKEDGLYG